MRITGLWRYPVKSMGGEALQSIAVDQWGLLGDRVWAVKDKGLNSIQAAKKSPVLMQCSARFEQKPSSTARSSKVAIRLPEGHEVQSGEPDTDAALSTLLGRPVELSPIIEPQSAFKRKPPPPGTDVQAYLRDMFARTDDEPLPDLSGFPADVMAYEAPPGTWFDAYPILLMTKQSFSALSAARAESSFDVRRFRPNILIDAGGSGYVENSWVGKRLRIGDAVLAIELACPRCIMTTHPVDELPKDPKIMRTLVQQNGGNAGVYARVVTPGVIRQGDVCALEL